MSGNRKRKRVRRPSIIVDHLEIEEDCPICMDSLQKTDLVVTRCGHSFHSSCLFKHLSKHDNCPCCRGIIV